jgi:hypothetical protein
MTILTERLRDVILFSSLTNVAKVSNSHRKQERRGKLFCVAGVAESINTQQPW